MYPTAADEVFERSMEGILNFLCSNRPDERVFAPIGLCPHHPFYHRGSLRPHDVPCIDDPARGFRRSLRAAASRATAW